MKRKLFSITLFAVLSFAFTGCGTGIGENLLGAYNMTQCQYSYKSVSNLSVSGINLSNGTSALTPTNIAKLTGILTGSASSIPMNFTVNLDMNNPNTTATMLSGLQYNIKIDGIQFTNGQINQAINIPANGSSVLPVTVGVDVAKLIKENGQSSVLNIVKNIIGMGSKASNVQMDIRPTILLGAQPITSPMAIPINFSFGGK